MCFNQHFSICFLLHNNLNFCIILEGFVLYSGVMPPQQQNQLCRIRFSVSTYLQQSSFPEEHCKGAWLAGCVFVVLTLTHIITMEKKSFLSVLCVSMFLFFCLLKLCAWWSICLFAYILLPSLGIFIFFYLMHNAELFFCYVHTNLYNGAGSFYLILASV